jgi:hypothetical protein
MSAGVCGLWGEQARDGNIGSRRQIWRCKIPTMRSKGKGGEFLMYKWLCEEGED